jgi:hypothetical protein
MNRNPADDDGGACIGRCFAYTLVPKAQEAHKKSAGTDAKPTGQQRVSV